MFSSPAMPLCLLKCLQELATSKLATFVVSQGCTLPPGPWHGGYCCFRLDNQIYIKAATHIFLQVDPHHT